MKTLVLYDSAFGNTEQVARRIGSAITGDVQVLRIDQINPSTLEQVDVLFIGSPTQSGKPTPAMRDFLGNVPPSALRKTRVAAFDTRLSGIFVGIFGYAAAKIANNLTSKGAVLASSPAGFLVNGKKGPLKEGELERAALWAKQVMSELPLVGTIFG